jgi:DNA-binding CsgD family transcriptional regulator/catechol 2,3-dioxygenase-like lactoylglutathione lyase family enzyme
VSNRERGRPPHPDVLTPAQWRVVDAVRHGLSNRQIAARRGISLDAVKFHVANAVRKLGVENRAALRKWRGIPAGSALRRVSGGGAMLGALGQVSRTVRDIPRAVEWYGGVLGLPHLYTFGDLAFFDCAGTRLYLQQSDDPPAQQSVLYFRVGDIQAAYDELRERGVAFTQAPHLIFRHESGVEEWMAFFADPDGHPLAIMCQVG